MKNIYLPVIMRFENTLANVVKLIAVCIIAPLLLIACNRNEVAKTPSPLETLHPDTLSDIFDYANKTLNEHEESKIDQYVRRHQLNLITTPTGLRYRIFLAGSGDNAQPGDVVIFNYTLRMINGIVIAESEKESPQEVMVEKSEMIAGLHELVQYMNIGAKARAIIPSRLGHGLTGDQERIPKGATLIYDIEIVDIITIK